MVALNQRFAGLRASLEWSGLLREQTAVAQDTRATEFKTANGFGQHRARISWREYCTVKRRYGHLYASTGGNPWFDLDFVKAYLRDNDHIRVKTTRGTRGQEITQAAPLPKGTIYVPKHYART